MLQSYVRKVVLGGKIKKNEKSAKTMYCMVQMALGGGGLAQNIEKPLVFKVFAMGPNGPNARRRGGGAGTAGVSRLLRLKNLKS